MANQGGILQKLQQLPDKQRKAFLTQFAQWAQKNGLNIQELQQNPQALEEAMTAFVQAVQGEQQTQPVTAKLGAKLNYIRDIKGACPEGQELVYFKQGGRVCKQCIEKGAAGAKAKPTGKDAVNEFKKKKACGGSKMKFELGGETPQKPKKEEPKKPEQRLDPRTTKVLPGGKYPTYWTSKERQLWERLHGDNDEGAAAVENKGVGKNKCGGRVKKHQQGGLLIPFYQGGTPKGGVKRFSVSSTNGGATKYFDTKEEAKAYQRTQKPGTTVWRDAEQESRGQVLKVDRTKEKATQYGRQKLEAYNHLPYKQAYAAAKKTGNKYFAYKGKVYKTDVANGKNNITEMEQHYGNNLGWTGDPKMGTKQSMQARAQYRKETDAKKGNRNAVYKGKTNKQVSEEADRKQTWNSADFIDAVSPQTAIGNFISMGASALTGDKFTPKVYKAGYNVPGLAKDLVEGNYGDAAFRGLDAYLMFGAPGASRGLDWAGTRFAPKLGTMGPKSAYISRKATEPIVDETGKTVGRQLNSWAQRAISGNGTSSVRTFGQRSMQRAANEGMLDRFAINGGMNNATRYGNAAVQNSKTGTTYIYRNSVNGQPIGNAYDNAIDAGVNGISPFLFGSEPVVQQAYQVGQ